MEVDIAGNRIRRAGAEGFPQAAFGGQCPKLAIHAAFAAPAEHGQFDLIVIEKMIGDGEAVGHHLDRAHRDLPHREDDRRAAVEQQRVAVGENRLPALRHCTMVRVDRLYLHVNAT